MKRILLLISVMLSVLSICAQTFPKVTSFAAAYYGDKEEQPEGIWLLQLYDAKDSAVVQINLIAKERCRLNDTYTLNYDNTLAGTKSSAYVVIDKGATILGEGSLKIEWQSTSDSKPLYAISGQVTNGEVTYDVDVTIPCKGSYNVCALDAYNDFGDTGLSTFEYATVYKPLLDDPDAIDFEAPKSATGKTKEYTITADKCEWIDKTQEYSYWQMVGRVSSFIYVSISPSSTTKTSGTYTSNELDQSSSFVAIKDLWGGVNKIFFQSGTCALSDSDNSKQLEASLLGYNGTLYTIHMTATSQTGITNPNAKVNSKVNGIFLKDDKILIYHNNRSYRINGSR